MEGGGQIDGGDDRTRVPSRPLSRRVLPDRFIQDALATGILSKKSSFQSARLVWQTIEYAASGLNPSVPAPTRPSARTEMDNPWFPPRGWPLKPSKLRQSLALEQVVVERSRLMRSYAPTSLITRSHRLPHQVINWP